MRTLEEASGLLRARKVSPVELTEECLAQIEKLNPSLNAFITVTADSALTCARAAGEEIARGDWRGPLHGIPVGVKDMIDTAGIRTTAASELHKDRVPTEDADVVRKLKAAGAVLLGKQNLHEFAYGGSSMISCFGEVRNPRDPSRIAGGSSGGSAVAVAAGMGYAAVGTDTAGSIRLPAAYCGVVGLKPTYGRVNAKGVIPLSASLDHVGPIARTVADAALVFEVLCETGLPPDFRSTLGADMRRLRVGIPRAFFFDDVDAEIVSAVERSIEALRPWVAEIRDLKLAVDTDRTLQMAESFRGHAESSRRTPHLYQPETLRRIRAGENITPAEYERSVRALEEGREEIRKVFENVDVLVTPTVPVPPAQVENLRRHPEDLRSRELLMLRNTRPFNVWGIPAISVPCGFTSDGMPVGLQIAAAPGREDLVFQVALRCEPQPIRKTA